MRNIVEHGQISGSSDTTVRSGCSRGHALHHVDLGADAEHRPGRGLLDPVEDPLGRPDPVGELHHVVRALGVHDHLAVGCSARNCGDVLGPEALVHRAVALPEEERRLLDVALLEPAELEARVPHPHRPPRRSPCRSAVLRPRCWSGKNSTLISPGTPLAERPVEDRPRVRRRAHRAAVLAHERLQRGRGVHVGDGHDLGDVGDRRQRCPSTPRPGRCRPCRPWSSRR